jgi:hypothetical protein
MQRAVETLLKIAEVERGQVGGRNFCVLESNLVFSLSRTGKDHSRTDKDHSRTDQDHSRTDQDHSRTDRDHSRTDRDR